MDKIRRMIKINANCLIFTILVLFFVCSIFVDKLQIGKQIVRLNNIPEFPDIDPLGCYQTLTLHKVQTYICVKKNDQFVSKKIAYDGAWEPNNVQNLMKAMSLYDDAIFIDGGCNIGMYTLMVAAMGREVVAVDAMADNLAYVRKSLELGTNNTGKVVLLHNSISNTHSNLYPVSFISANDHKDNPGAERLVDQAELIEYNLKADGPPVTSITLPDIFSSISSKTIILKLDIQGYECKALTIPGIFNSSHHLPYIFMEWNEIAGPSRDSLCPDLDGLIEMLKHAGYSPRDAASLGILPEDCLQNVVTDVLWVHHTALPLWDQDVVVACRFQRQNGEFSPLE